MYRFDLATATALRALGWHVAAIEGGATLASLQAAGAPFRSDKYFREFARAAEEIPSPGAEVAYRPELVLDSLNKLFDAATALVQQLSDEAPTGTVPCIAPASVYVCLLWEHAKRAGTFPLRGYYTWAADRYEYTHLAVGVFGRERPLIVAPLADLSGRGVGAMAVLLPSAAAGELQWLRAQRGA